MPAGYYRGFLLEANTSGNNKTLNIRDSDTNSLHTFTGPFGNNTINHNGQSQIEYTFTPPFVAHLVRDEPALHEGNNNGPTVQWQKFGIKYLVDPWPELSMEFSAFLNLGTPGEKYVTGAVIPMDTGANNVSLVLATSDNNFSTSGNNAITIGPFNTPANEKTPTPVAFTVPFVFHEVQIQPQNNVRGWWSEIQWNFEQWPERTTESSFWFNLGTPRAKYVRGAIIPIETANNNTVYVVNSDGGGGSAAGPFKTGVNVKVPTSFAFDPPFVAHEFQVDPTTPARTWWQETQWDFEVWPELIPEYTAWFNMGTPGAKYTRGAVIPIETGGNNAVLTLISSDGSSVPMGTVKTSAVPTKTPTPFAFKIPLIGHEYQIQTNAPIRIWLDEARWDFDAWPELITEATGWLNVMPGGQAGFLQGLLVPVEAAGQNIQLSLLTDVSPVPIPLTAIRTPLPNVKTPIPYSLATPVVCHQVQIVPTAPCRIWLNEIQWIAEATPEQASTWSTQLTAHGCVGFHSILRIDASYTSTAQVNLAIAAFDGTSPQTLVLPSTGGVKQKTLFTPTFNKGKLFSYGATSSAVFQLFLPETTIWIAEWGRTGLARPYTMLGGAFDDKASV